MPRPVRHSDRRLPNLSILCQYITEILALCAGPQGYTRRVVNVLLRLHAKDGPCRLSSGVCDRQDRFVRARSGLAWPPTCGWDSVCAVVYDLVFLSTTIWLRGGVP